MSESVYRPANAGTKEVASYGDSFNKENLKNLKSMFESKNVSNTNGFVKSERVVKTSSSIGNLKSKFSASPSNTNNITFAPDYSKVTVNNVESKTKYDQSSKDVVKTVAGEREVPEYVPTVSLSAAKAMFSKTTADEYKPRNKIKFTPKTVRVAENGTEVVRNIDIIDDRPTSLTTSLANAKSRFENNNEPTTQTITKEVPSWEGKDTAKSKMNSAKTVFQISENDSPQRSSNEPPKQIVLPTENPEKQHMVEKPKPKIEENIIEPEQNLIETSNDQNLENDQEIESNNGDYQQEESEEQTVNKVDFEDQKEKEESEEQKEESEEQKEESEDQIEETIIEQVVEQSNCLQNDGLEEPDSPEIDDKEDEKEIEHSSLVNGDFNEGEVNGNDDGLKVNQVEENPSIKQNTTKSYDSNDVLSDASTSSDGQNKYLEDSSTK